MLIDPLEGFHLQQLTSSEKIDANCSPSPHRPEIRAALRAFTHVRRLAWPVPLRKDLHTALSDSTLELSGCTDKKALFCLALQREREQKQAVKI